MNRRIFVRNDIFDRYTPIELQREFKFLYRTTPLANERRNEHRYQFQLFFIVIYIVLRLISYIEQCLNVQGKWCKYSHNVMQAFFCFRPKSVIA